MATSAILASRFKKFSQGSMPPDPLDGCTCGVPFKAHFAKGPCFSDPGPSMHPLLVRITKINGTIVVIGLLP